MIMAVRIVTGIEKMLRALLDQQWRFNLREGHAPG